MSARVVAIRMAKERMKFSAAHFTLFSATERERLHGHNYRVEVTLTTEVGEDGISFDYARAKQLITALCEELDEWMLIPEHSPHLRLEEQGDRLLVHFADECIPFLQRDVKRLPVRNITLEELSGYFIDRLQAETAFMQANAIRRLEVFVSSGDGQQVGSVRDL